MNLWPMAALLAASIAGCHDDAPGPPPPPVAAEDFVVETTPPEPGSARALALAAIEHAHDFKLYSLQPFVPPPPSEPSQKEGAGRAMQAASDAYEMECDKGGCLQRNRILGQVDIGDRHGQDVMKRVLRTALDRVPNYASACAAQFRHAIGFRSGRSEYRVLLCYECGQLAVDIDGMSRGQGQTSQMTGEPELDAILARANVRLAAKP